MRNRTLADLDRVVALGGGHGLGRVMSSLALLGARLTGIVATTDNGGSTGRIRHAEGGIAWGDTRNCLNQLISQPSVASAMFEYRFNGNGELAGHNLGNLMLKALDNLCVRPLEAINLIRNLLKIEALLIPMSEQPTDLVAHTEQGQAIYGEVSIDHLNEFPHNLQLEPSVTATKEAIEAISRADLLLIGPGSFFTSIMPLLLLTDLAQALRRSNAMVIYIDNLGKESNAIASQLSLTQRIALLEEKVGATFIDAVLTAPCYSATLPTACSYQIVQWPLAAKQEPNLHDRRQLYQAIEATLQRLSPL